MGHTCCMCRRAFLTKLPAAGLGLAALAEMAPRLWAQAAEPVAAKPLVRAAFLTIPGKFWMGWPGTAYPVEKARADYTRQISQAGAELDLDIAFSGQPLQDDAGVDRFMQLLTADPPDAVLISLQHMQTWGWANKIAGSGVPTIIFSPVGMAFTGHLGVSRNKGVYLVSSMDFEGVRSGLRMVKTRDQLKRARIARLVGNETNEVAVPNHGILVRNLPRVRFEEELARVGDTDEVKAIAADYARRARKIVEPNERDRLNAARNYVASKNIMAAEDANAITMDCLGLIGGRRIPSPPCLAWSKLNDEGVPAACEGDLDAAYTYLLTMNLLGKPGFMQDPVPETVHNTFIGAHCTAPTRLHGFDKPPVPFILRSHSESNLGVAMQVLWEPGARVTICKFEANGQRFIVGEATVLENIATPPAGGCRTSVRAALDDVADTRDTKGFHQVFLYGEYERQLRAYMQLYGVETAHI